MQDKNNVTFTICCFTLSTYNLPKELKWYIIQHFYNAMLLCQKFGQIIKFDILK